MECGVGQLVDRDYTAMSFLETERGKNRVLFGEEQAAN